MAQRVWLWGAIFALIAAGQLVVIEAIAGAKPSSGKWWAILGALLLGDVLLGVARRVYRAVQG